MDTVIEVDGELRLEKSNVCLANFTFKIVFAVNVPGSTSGYVYVVKSVYGDQGSCFISNSDATSLVVFSRLASAVVSGLQYIKIRRYEEIWGKYIYNRCKEYRTSEDFKSRVLVTTLGRQPNSDIWVLAPNIQIEGSGQLISEEHHQYYWDVQSSKLTPLSISLPLSEQVRQCTL
jgi:hypothetical protein